MKILLAVLIFVLAAMGPLLSPFAQIENMETPPAATAGNNELTVGWMIFHGIWILILLALFYLLRSDKNRKVLIKTPAEKKNGEDEKAKDEADLLAKWKFRWLLTLFAFLILIFLLLLGNQFWWSALILVGSATLIILSRWETCVFFYKTLIPDGQMKVQTKAPGAKETTTFKDIGGLDDVIEKLGDIIVLHKDPEEAKPWDIRPVKGVLLTGPPGCGKTLLAKAIAGEANMYYLRYHADEIGDIYARSGAKAIKAIFTEARAHEPCLLFFDEIDALGRRRGYDVSGEFDHALTALLCEMDGFEKDSRILVIAATNREDILDEALIRPGRFDKKFLVPLPDVNGREHILKIHTAKKCLADEVNLREIVERTPGFSGADLGGIANEAAQLARKRYEEKKRQNILTTAIGTANEPFVEPRIVTNADFDEAILIIRMGPARKTAISEGERRIIACHEIGHAVVTAEKGLEILDKVTLMARNWALGITETHAQETQLPSKTLLLARITSLLGGRAAEEVFQGKENVTTSGGNDFERAAELARRMVCEWGMGKAGPTIFHRTGAHLAGLRILSEDTMQKIDQEVAAIISACLQEAQNIITVKKEEARHLTELLMEKSVLDAKEITAVLRKERQPTA